MRGEPGARDLIHKAPVQRSLCSKPPGRAPRNALKWCGALFHANCVPRSARPRVRREFSRALAPVAGAHYGWESMVSTRRRVPERRLHGANVPGMAMNRVHTHTCAARPLALCFPPHRPLLPPHQEEGLLADNFIFPSKVPAQVRVIIRFV